MKTRVLIIIGIPVSIVAGLFFWLFTTENRFDIVSSHSSEPNKHFSESLFISLMKSLSPFSEIHANLYSSHYVELFLIIVIIFTIWCCVSSLVKIKQLKIK